MRPIFFICMHAWKLSSSAFYCKIFCVCALCSHCLNASCWKIILNFRLCRIIFFEAITSSGDARELVILDDKDQCTERGTTLMVMKPLIIGCLSSRLPMAIFSPLQNWSNFTMHGHPTLLACHHHLKRNNASLLETLSRCIVKKDISWEVNPKFKGDFLFIDGYWDCSHTDIILKSWRHFVRIDALPPTLF